MKKWLQQFKSLAAFRRWVASPPTLLPKKMAEPCELYKQLSEKIRDQTHYQNDREFATSFTKLSQILSNAELTSNETALKKSLRDFLRLRELENMQSFGIDYDFKHCDSSVSKLCQDIATLIANDTEPILWVLKPSLNKEALYLDEFFLPLENSPADSLISFTETKANDNKRRLKDFKRFIPVKNGTQLVDAAFCCETALNSTPPAFYYQTQNDAKTALSPQDIALLCSWRNSAAREVIDILTTENTDLENSKVWVSAEFITHGFKPGTLGYELCVLQECLANSGITRRHLTDHDVDVLPITYYGIKRFKKTWETLSEEEKERLNNFRVTAYQNQYLFKDIINSILSRIDTNYFFPNGINIRCVDILSCCTTNLLEKNKRVPLFQREVVSERIYSRDEAENLTRGTLVIKKSLKIAELLGKFHSLRESDKKDYTGSIKAEKSPAEQLQFFKGSEARIKHNEDRCV